MRSIVNAKKQNQNDVVDAAFDRHLRDAVANRFKPFLEFVFPIGRNEMHDSDRIYYSPISENGQVQDFVDQTRADSTTQGVPMAFIDEISRAIDTGRGDCNEGRALGLLRFWN